MPNVTALQAAIKMLTDAINDTLSAVEPNQNILKEVFDYENLLPDLIALVPQIGQIPSEVSALQPADYASLLQGLVSELNVTNEKAQAIIAASLKVLADIATVVVPDVQNLIAVIQAA
jgi:hypothetical protein